MNAPEIDQSLPIACQVGVIPTDERERWMEVVRQIYSSVKEIVELPDGYSLKIVPDQLQLLGEHVSRDRKCCAFLRWEIIVEQANGSVSLRMRGPEGTKEFIEAALLETDLIPANVIRAAGFSGGSRTTVTLDNVEPFAKDLKRKATEPKQD